MKARLAVSTLWGQNWASSVHRTERENSGKTNEVWFLATGSGNVGDKDSCPSGSSLLAWLHHCLRPMQTMAVKASLDRPPGPPCQPTALTWLLSPWDGLSSRAQYVMDRVTNSSHWFLFHHCLSVGAQAGCWLCWGVSSGHLADCVLVPVADFPLHMVHAWRGCGSYLGEKHR